MFISSLRRSHCHDHNRTKNIFVNIFRFIFHLLVVHAGNRGDFALGRRRRVCEARLNRSRSDEAGELPGCSTATFREKTNTHRYALPRLPGGANTLGPHSFISASMPSIPVGPESYSTGFADHDHAYVRLGMHRGSVLHLALGIRLTPSSQREDAGANGIGVIQ